MPGNIGRGHYALPTDQIGIARGNQEGYALPESVARVLAPMMVSTDMGNSLQLGSDGLLFVLSGGGGGGQPDSIDDNPQRVGSVWQPGDRLAVAASAPGSVDERVDAESWVADMVSNSTTLQTVLNTYVSGQPDSIDDNPQRAGNVWQSGDQLAAAQPGSPDDKVDAESWVADMIVNSTTINSLIAAFGSPFDIYLDVTNGDDANDGLTPATAVQTDAGVAAVMAANGVDDGTHAIVIHLSNSPVFGLSFGVSVSNLPNGRRSAPVFLVGSGVASMSTAQVGVANANLICVGCDLLLYAGRSDVKLVGCGACHVYVEHSDVKLGDDFRIIDPPPTLLLFSPFVKVVDGGSVSGSSIVASASTFAYAGVVSVLALGSLTRDSTSRAVDVDIDIVSLSSANMVGAVVATDATQRSRGCIRVRLKQAATASNLVNVSGPVDVDVSCFGLTCDSLSPVYVTDRARVTVSVPDDASVPPVSFTNSSFPVAITVGSGAVFSIDRGDASAAGGMEVVVFGGSEVVLGQNFMAAGAFHVSSSAASTQPMFSAHDGSRISVYIDGITAPASSSQVLADVGPLSELYIYPGDTRANYIAALALAGAGAVAPTGRVAFGSTEEYVGTPAPLSW